jgi:uncharacterized protein YecE (DUF72 family)
MSAIHIWTSGWSYDGWRGPFYSEVMPKKDWLSWYGLHFNSTEINGSFYRTPSLEAVRAWREQTPEGFVFSWKASKFITHWKRLGPTSPSSVKLMNTRLRALGHKLGPVLFQLPARFKADRERLAKFLKVLSPRKRYVFEFRDSSWFETSILHLLREQNVALCFSDHHDAPTPWEVTANFVYVRGHGPSGEYKDRYPLSKMHEWAKAIRHWERKKMDVYCYFDNDQKSAAPHDAKRLLNLIAARISFAKKNRQAQCRSA